MQIPEVYGAPAAPHEPKNPLVAITDATESATYSASFSPQAGFYLLGYSGPTIPWQKVVAVENSSMSAFHYQSIRSLTHVLHCQGFTYVLSDNKKLNETNAEFQSPIVTISTINSDGYELNVKEMRPPGLDESGRVRYPVLFRVSVQFSWCRTKCQAANVLKQLWWSGFAACRFEIQS